MWQPFQQEISTAACKRLELETHLRGALARGELSLHYQPQVNLRDGRVEGVEALLRWKHKQLGMVSPASFIPVAEETGLIVPIGEWVLEEACAQSCWWRDAGMPIKVSVNVSAVQFVRALGPHGDKPELAQSIVALARALGKQVIAEGVETQEHLDALLD